MSRHSKYPLGEGKARRRAYARLAARRNAYFAATPDERAGMTEPGSLKARTN